MKITILFSLLNICLVSLTCFAGEIFDHNQSFPTKGYPHVVAVGDLNNDDRNDIIVVHQANYDNVIALIWFQDNFGEFKDSVPLVSPTRVVHIYDVKIADINGDRHNDILIPRSSEGYLAVYYQKHRKNGQFSEEFKYPGIGRVEIIKDRIITWGYNRNTPDKYTVTILRWNKRLRDLEKIKEVNFNRSERIGFVQFADIDLDGEIEILAHQTLYDYPAYYRFPNKILIYDKDLELKRTIDYMGLAYQFEVADMDNNGYPDLVINNLGFRRISFLMQDKDGFKETLYYRFPEPFHKVSVGDVNNDGLQDFLATTWIGNYEAYIQAFIQRKGEFVLKDEYKVFGRLEGQKIADIMKDGKNDILFMANYHYEPGNLHIFFKGDTKRVGILRAKENVKDNPEQSRALEVLLDKIKIPSGDNEETSNTTDSSTPESSTTVVDAEIQTSNQVSTSSDKAQDISDNQVRETAKTIININKEAVKNKVSVIIFNVWNTIMKWGKIYRLKDGRLEEFKGGYYE